MKRRIIVILSLILCFMLSCDEKTLDKVFIQGGMDASSPKVVVAVDPDRVEAFEKGEVTYINKASEAKSPEEVEEKDTPLLEEAVSITQEESGNTRRKTEAELKSYVDFLFSSEKIEITKGVEKAKEDTISELKNIESSILSSVSETQKEVLSKNELLSASLDEKSRGLEEEIDTLSTLLNSTLSGAEEKISALYTYIDSLVPDLIDQAKAEILEEVRACSSDTSSASYGEEDIKAYVDKKCAEIEEEITSNIKQLTEEISSNVLSVVEDDLNDILNKRLEDFEKNINIYLDDPTPMKEERVEVKVEEGEEEPTESVNGLLFKKTKSGYEVVGYEKGMTSLIIPSSVDGVPVTGIADKAFKESEISGDVVLPKTIERIGDEAFMNSVCLDGKIYLPSSLKTIGTRAFYNCNKIEGDLIIPDSVESIGDEAFALCLKLGKSVYGGKGLMTVGQDVFLTSGIRKSHLPPAISKKLGF